MTGDPKPIGRAKFARLAKDARYYSYFGDKFTASDRSADLDGFASCNEENWGQRG